jgi:hypothetical protein
MNAVWRDDDYYLALADSRRIINAGPVSGVPPRTSPAPSKSDVQRVRGLAEQFNYGDDGWVLDDDNEWAINLPVAVVGTAFGIGLIAFCIVGGVTVARWLGWTA